MVGIAAMLGSGAVQFTAKGIVLKGIGDIINIILVVIIACAIYMFYKEN